ncbi:MAG: MATE family efflux transporter, partial [Bacteroides sp.]
LQVCYSNALRGIGDATGLFFASFIGYFAIGLPLAYLLGIHTNLTTLGVWLSYPIGLLIAGLLYAWRFYHSINKQLPRYKKIEAH